MNTERSKKKNPEFFKDTITEKGQFNENIQAKNNEFQ